MFEALAQIILVGIFYWPGWVVLRAVSLGHYPPKKGTKHDNELVAVVGLAFFMAVLIAIYS